MNENQASQAKFPGLIKYKSVFRDDRPSTFPRLTLDGKTSPTRIPPKFRDSASLLTVYNRDVLYEIGRDRSRSDEIGRTLTDGSKTLSDYCTSSNENPPRPNKTSVPIPPEEPRDQRTSQRFYLWEDKLEPSSPDIRWHNPGSILNIRYSPLRDQERKQPRSSTGSRNRGTQDAENCRFLVGRHPRDELQRKRFEGPRNRKRPTDNAARYHI